MFCPSFSSPHLSGLSVSCEESLSPCCLHPPPYLHTGSRDVYCQQVLEPRLSLSHTQTAAAGAAGKYRHLVNKIINNKTWGTDSSNIKPWQRVLLLSPWIWSTEMSAEKILVLVRSIICWSALRTLSRIRERSDRMSGAVATTLVIWNLQFIRDNASEELPEVYSATLRKPWNSVKYMKSDLLHCLRRISRRVAITDPRRRQGADLGVVS